MLYYHKPFKFASIIYNLKYLFLKIIFKFFEIKFVGLKFKIVLSVDIYLQKK